MISIARGERRLLTAAAVGRLAFETDVEMFAVSAGMADEGGAAGVGRVLEYGVEPLFGCSLFFGLLIEGSLVVPVDEQVFDVAAGDELVDEPERFFDVQVIATDVVKTIVVWGWLVARIGDVYVAAGLMGTMWVDGAAITEADVAYNEWICLGESVAECVEYTHDFADGVVSSPGAVWVEDVVFVAKGERFGIDDAAAGHCANAACEGVFGTFPDEDAVAIVEVVEIKLWI